MDASSPCVRCLNQPRLIHVPGNAFPGALPASIAWLRSQNPQEVMEAIREAKAALAAKNVQAFRDIQGRISGTLGVHDPRAFLSTVILSLAARGSIRLFEVTHRPGFLGRLFGRSPAATIHIAPSGSEREKEGAVETKLLAGARKSGGPHGPTVQRVVESLFSSPVTSPGGDILTVAKEEGVARGVGRWIPTEEIPAMTQSGGSFLGDLIEKTLDQAIRKARFYETKSAPQFAPLEEMRRRVSESDRSKIEAEIERALVNRTYVPD